MKQVEMEDGLGQDGNGWPETGESAALHHAAATAANMDAAVAEVFVSMLGTDCVPTRRQVGWDGERVSAAIRLSGAREGKCVVEMPADAGDWLTDALLSSEADWDDEMIDDAVGELCNMVTGSLKRRLGPCLGECRISLPEVRRVRGEYMEWAKSTGVWRFYRVSDRTLGVGLCGWRET